MEMCAQGTSRVRNRTKQSERSMFEETIREYIAREGNGKARQSQHAGVGRNPTIKQNQPAREFRATHLAPAGRTTADEVGENQRLAHDPERLQRAPLRQVVELGGDHVRPGRERGAAGAEEPRRGAAVGAAGVRSRCLAVHNKRGRVFSFFQIFLQKQRENCPIFGFILLYSALNKHHKNILIFYWYW